MIHLALLGLACAAIIGTGLICSTMQKDANCCVRVNPPYVPRLSISAASMPHAPRAANIGSREVLTSVDIDELAGHRVAVR
jgi:hypothetical protein